MNPGYKYHCFLLRRLPVWSLIRGSCAATTSRWQEGPCSSLQWPWPAARGWTNHSLPSEVKQADTCTERCIPPCPCHTPLGPHSGRESSGGARQQLNESGEISSTFLQRRWVNRFIWSELFYKCVMWSIKIRTSTVWSGCISRRVRNWLLKVRKLIIFYYVLPDRLPLSVIALLCILCASLRPVGAIAQLYLDLKQPFNGTVSCRLTLVIRNCWTLCHKENSLKRFMFCTLDTQPRWKQALKSFQHTRFSTVADHFQTSERRYKKLS